MKQNDKNIFIVTIFIIIFLLTWTLTSYNSIKKDSETLDKSELQQEITEEDSKKAQELKEPEKIIPIISAAELNKKIFTDDNFIIIDARTAEEFSDGHIRGSLHISEFDSTRQHRTIVFVTVTGNEDAIITYYRSASDTNKIYNLTGGFNAWKKAGYNTVVFNIEHNFANQAKIKLVEPRTLNELLTSASGDKFIVIDTRRAGNYKKGHIQGALNIPFIELERRYKEIPIAKKIYMYGTDEKTSFDAGVLLHDLGFIGTKTINGGFDAWTEYGYPTVQ